MTLSKIVKKISETEEEMDNNDVERVLKKFLTEIKESLKRNEEVMLQDFGRFYLKEFAEYQGFNPKTRQRITVSARRKLYFKPYAELKALKKIN